VGLNIAIRKGKANKGSSVDHDVNENDRLCCMYGWV